MNVSLLVFLVLAQTSPCGMFGMACPAPVSKLGVSAPTYDGAHKTYRVTVERGWTCVAEETATSVVLKCEVAK